MSEESPFPSESTEPDSPVEPLTSSTTPAPVHNGSQRRATVDHIDQFIQNLWEGKIYMKKETEFDQTRWEFSTFPHHDAVHETHVQIQIDKHATFRTSDRLYFSFNYAPPAAGTFEGFAAAETQHQSVTNTEQSAPGEVIHNPGSRVDTELIPISTQQFSEAMLVGLREILNNPQTPGDDDTDSSSGSRSENSGAPSQSESGGEMHQGYSSDDEDVHEILHNIHNQPNTHVFQPTNHISGGESQFDNSNFSRAIVINMNAASQVLNIGTGGIHGHSVGPFN